MTNIKTQTKTAFGQERIYITDEVQAQAINQLTGKITVNKKDLAALAMLGCTINGVVI